MAKFRDYPKLAADILKEIGGEDNLVSFSRCATRLRLVLKQLPDNAIEKVKQLTGVITVVMNGGQFQIVIGTHVAEVYNAFILLIKNTDSTQMQPKRRIGDAIITTMSAVFAPIVYILAAAGILQGILIIIKHFYPLFSTMSTYSVLNFISWTPFVFLPVFIAITAARHFKCNEFIALLCCCALINPDWANLATEIAQGKSITFMFLPLAKTIYTSSVLPPLFLIWLLSYLERWLNQKLPDIISPLFTPLICVVIMVPGTLLLIGPLTSAIATTIATSYNYIFESVPALAAGIIGGFWQVIVIFGVHWGITPVVVTNFDIYGRDSFQAFQTMAVIGQMAAAFTCGLKSRQKNFKPIAFSAALIGVFGITEPAIYGVTLRLKRPFVYGCIGGAIGAIVTSFFGSYYYAYAGLPGMLTIVNAISPDNPTSFIGEVTGATVTIIITFLLVYILGFKETEETSEKTGY